MSLYSEQELKQFVEYWGGDATWLKQPRPPRRHKREATATLLLALHHPEKFYDYSWFWQSSQMQFIAWLWSALSSCDRHIISVEVPFRTREVYEYFRELLQLWIGYYGKKQVFIFTRNNYRILPVETLVDQLWTVTVV